MHADSVNLNFKTMKKGIHPENYRLVAFKDMSNDVVVHHPFLRKH